MIRRLGNTPLVPLLGGGPAVLLQVAHPLVAAGVFEHSDVRRDLWRRLVQTLRALYLIAFGTKEEADRAAELVQAVHAHVHGATRTRLGRFPPGTRYSAFDPELMLWVHATLVQASLAAYERFVDPLSREDQERYFQEMALVARLFGTPASVIPRSLVDFREYFAAQINGETIAVTTPAKEVAAVILEARLRAPLRLFVPAHRLSTAGLLPPPNIARIIAPVALVAAALIVAGFAGTAKNSGTSVGVAQSKLGRILVDGRGHTLHLFEKDKRGKSSCNGACARAWPPLISSGKPRAKPGLRASVLGRTKRRDGRWQLTYNRHPLYTFVEDTRKGQTNGEGIEAYGAEWYVVSPAGAKVEKNDGDDSSSGGYGGYGGYGGP